MWHREKGRDMGLGEAPSRTALRQGGLLPGLLSSGFDLKKTLATHKNHHPPAFEISECKTALLNYFINMIYFLIFFFSFLFRPVLCTLGFGSSQLYK